MAYGGGLLRTQKGRTSWEVFYSGPGPGLSGRRGTISKEPRNRVSDVGNQTNPTTGATRTCILPSADPE